MRSPCFCTSGEWYSWLMLWGPNRAPLSQKLEYGAPFGGTGTGKSDISRGLVGSLMSIIAAKLSASVQPPPPPPASEAANISGLPGIFVALWTHLVVARFYGGGLFKQP